MDHFDNLCARICVSFADEKKKGPTKKLHYYGLLFADKKLYHLIACTNSKHKSHSESDYGILVKRRCGCICIYMYLCFRFLIKIAYLLEQKTKILTCLLYC